MDLRHVLLAPDSFKGNMDAAAVCRIMQDAVLRFFPKCRCTCLPAADGGEGSAACIASVIEGTWITHRVMDPWKEPVDARYFLFSEGTKKAAVIELASAAGLPLVGERRDPSQTTTYGVGQLCLHALQSGIRHLILTLGGSATNDGGCGIAAALGTRFLRADGGEFLPVGATLDQIASIDPAASDYLLSGVEVTLLCDVQNPLCGEQGAAATYAPQKGADAAMVEQLEHGLFHLAAKLEQLGRPVLNLPGGGAAGGVGAGGSAFLHGSLRSGIEYLLELYQFDHLLKTADLVFTGEGRLDGQTAAGKVVSGIARHAARLRVPVIAITGDAVDPLDPLYALGLTAAFPINRIAAPYEILRSRSREDLRHTMEGVLRLLSLS